VHDDDRPPARREPVEGAPDRGSRNHRGGVIGPGLNLRRGFVVPLLDGGLPPLVAAEIDEHANQPGFFPAGPEGHGPGRTGGAQERVLYQV